MDAVAAEQIVGVWDITPLNPLPEVGLQARVIHYRANGTVTAIVQSPEVNAAEVRSAGVRARATEQSEPQLPVPELSVAELSVAELSVAELPVPELSVAELPVPELSVAELPAPELSAPDDSAPDPSGASPQGSRTMDSHLFNGARFLLSGRWSVVDGNVVHREVSMSTGSTNEKARLLSAMINESSTAPISVANVHEISDDEMILVGRDGVAMHYARRQVASK